MNVVYNHEQLLNLISSIHELTDIWINIHDLTGKDIQIRDAQTDFCRAINSSPEGHARCVSCDADAARLCREYKKAYHYRCHAGICETLVPITGSGEIISYLGFGQLLDTSPVEEQWKRTKAALSWYPYDLEELHRKFLTIRRLAPSKTAALTEILKVLALHVDFNNVVIPTAYTDLQKLEIYISRHYMEKLSMESISRELHFGTTKLCSLAKKLSGGHSLTWLIAFYRINEAQKLLIATDKPVSEVALFVGYEDYNYFTKVFKKIAGITPSRYRSTKQRQETCQSPAGETKEK